MPDTPHPPPDPVARARALTPLLAQAAPRIEAARELPADVLDAMHDAGMFRLLLPRSVGGAELDPATYLQAVEAIAAGDASVAWCMNQNSGCSMAAAFLAPEVAWEVFGPARAVLAWGQGKSRAVAVPGGWRVTGTWLFASGSRHATWLGGHAPTFAADGTPLTDAAGKPAERTMLFPREAARITDVWQVMGLRGTGSDTYAVEDLFVAADHALARDVMAERRETGLLYRFSTTHIYASGFAAVALGIARASLDAFVALARDKTPALASLSLRDNHVVQSRIAVAEATLRSARAWLLQTLREIQDAVAVSGALTMDQRAMLRLAATFAIHRAKDVVDMAYTEAGATAIFDTHPFERRFRDIHSVTQQVQGRAAHFETVGQHLLGMAVGTRWL